MWSVVECAFDIFVNVNYVNVLVSWVFKFLASMRYMIAVGVAAVLWVIWKTKISAYFDKVFSYDPCCVVAKVALWLSF